MSKQSEAKHTPGPWVANDKHSDSEYPWRVESDAGGYPNDGYVIAKLDGPDAEANALIIASAPELLEALHSVILTIEHLHEHPKCNARQYLFGVKGADRGEHGAIRKARAIIAKARGANE